MYNGNGNGFDMDEPPQPPHMWQVIYHLGLITINVFKFQFIHWINRNYQQLPLNNMTHTKPNQKTNNKNKNNKTTKMKRRTIKWLNVPLMVQLFVLKVDKPSFENRFGCFEKLYAVKQSKNDGHLISAKTRCSRDHVFLFGHGSVYVCVCVCVRE